MSRIQEELRLLRDEKYKAFMARLLPTVPAERIIGVRTPSVRAYAKRICDREDAADFLQKLPHTYLEEDALHSFLIAQIKDFDLCMAGIERFLPYVDNWAICDGLRVKCLAKDPQRLLPYIRRWLQSGHCYTIRFAVELLMLHFLDAHFDTAYADMVAQVRSEEYYVNMMLAWYFATALTKQYEQTLPYLQQRRLRPWVHNKTIQKAIESHCITDTRKQELRKLKIKE